MESCSDEKKKKKRRRGEDFSSHNKPLITTLTKTTIITTSITMITPPEDPNDHINLYLCLDMWNVASDFTFHWCKIDPTNKEVEVVEEEEEDPMSKSKSKFKPKSKPIFLSPISYMPTTTPKGFRAIPHSSSRKKKLVYALGGSTYGTMGRSSKAFVCDFASSSSTNPPVWEELPPMPSPMDITIGVASPLDGGKVYAFGNFDTEEEVGNPDSYTGVVFDPASRSWNPCPHPFKSYYINHSCTIRDSALVHTKDQNEFIVFNHKHHVAFDLATKNWEYSFSATVPVRTPDLSESSSSVAVGDVIFRFHNSKLYALDLASKKPRFKRVYGLEQEMPTTYETYGNTGYIAYLGKGKLCIVWAGRHPDETEPILPITCLKFWVGVCNQSNQLRAVVDRCEHYIAPGSYIYDFVAF